MPDEPVSNAQKIANNKPTIHSTGDKVGGDKITVGNISGSYTAIGAGAQVIVNQVQQALSSVDELEKSIQATERRLAESIQRKILSYTHLTAADSIDARSNPYKALLDYKLEDAPFFYGRISALTSMQQKMGNSRLTILHSDSGSGKTSLLQAGLAARLLADGHFPLYLRPYDQPPAQTIKKAFLPDYATLAELSRFNDDQMTLHGFLKRITHYLGERHLIIFLDQFEEFFTELNADQQHSFAAQLRECVESDLSVWWVLALRKEYFSDLRIFQALKPFENEYFLPTFKIDEAQEVIIKPAALKGVAYADGLVDQILVDIRQQTDVIPPAQVQLVCYTLFDELATTDNPTLISTELYNKPRGRSRAPGAEGILSSHLSRVLDRELKGKKRKVAGQVLEALVTSDLRRAKRSQASLQNTVTTEQTTLLANVLDILYANRLVRRELDDDDQPVFELAHDYLLNEIELDPETQARKAAQELLAQEVHAYQLHGTLLSKDKFDIINSQRDYLLIDETAAELLKKSETEIEAERRHELEQAQKLAQEQRLRAEENEKAAQRLRQRLILATIAVVIAFVAFGAAVWFGQQSQENANFAATKAVEAETEAANAATAQSEAQREAQNALQQEEIAVTAAAKATVAQGQAEIEAQNALDAQAEAEAAQLEAEKQARLAQAQALVVEANQLLERDEVEKVLVKAYQAITLTLATDRIIINEANAALYNVWNQQTQLPAARFLHDAAVRSAVFHPTENLILTRSDDNSARLWDFDGSQLALLPHDDFVWSAVFHPTENLILTISGSGARLWRYFPTLDEMLLQAERDMHIELTQAECETYFAEFDPAFCKNWDEK